MNNILFVCGKNKWRSPTAEQIFATYPHIDCTSAGLSHDAEVRISADLVDWATLIFVMEKQHKTKLASQFKMQLKGKKVVCLNIPDDYQFMEPQLIKLLETKVGPFLVALGYNPNEAV